MEIVAGAEQCWLLQHWVVNEDCLTTEMHSSAVGVSEDMG